MPDSGRETRKNSFAGLSRAEPLDPADALRALAHLVALLSRLRERNTTALAGPSPPHGAQSSRSGAS
jgi:hypothetical protein